MLQNSVLFGWYSSCFALTYSKQFLFNKETVMSHRETLCASYDIFKAIYATKSSICDDRNRLNCKLFLSVMIFRCLILILILLNWLGATHGIVKNHPQPEKLLPKCEQDSWSWLFYISLDLWRFNICNIFSIFLSQDNGAEFWETAELKIKQQWTIIHRQ